MSNPLYSGDDDSFLDFVAWLLPRMGVFVFAVCGTAISVKGIELIINRIVSLI